MCLQCCTLLATKLTQTFKLSCTKKMSASDSGNKTWCISRVTTTMNGFQCDWVISETSLSWVWPFGENKALYAGQVVSVLCKEQVSLLLVWGAGFDPVCAKEIQELFGHWLTQLFLMFLFLSETGLKNLDYLAFPTKYYTIANKLALGFVLVFLLGYGRLSSWSGNTVLTVNC